MFSVSEILNQSEKSAVCGGIFTSGTKDGSESKISNSVIVLERRHD